MEQQLLLIASKIQEKIGLYQREHVYRDILLQELRSQYSDVVPETVFPIAGMGNGHCLRLDVDIPSEKTIIEMKSTNAPTKEEVFWQVRTYLENTNRTTAYVINFMSKQRCVELFKVSKTEQVTAKNKMRIYEKSGPFYSEPLEQVFTVSAAH
jgi:GxxExxY protein